MLAATAAIRNRIEELKLSHNGYARQLARGDITGERRERLHTETALLGEEIATLEKLAQLLRLEPDPAKVEAQVRERMETVRGRLAADASLAAYPEEERDNASGEMRAFLWSLGEDTLTKNVRFLTAGREKHDPARTNRALPNILIHTLQEGPSPEARASASYELGILGVGEAIPALVAALKDEAIVADMAFTALCRFADEKLSEAGVPEQLRDQVKKAIGGSAG